MPSDLHAVGQTRISLLEVDVEWESKVVMVVLCTLRPDGLLNNFQASPMQGLTL